MTLHSVFVVVCECGQTVRLEAREGECGRCHRILVVERPGEVLAPAWAIAMAALAAQ